MHTSYNNSSLFWGDNALEKANPKLGVGPRSTYFSTLGIEDVMRIHPVEQMKDCGVTESDSYTLEFGIPNEHREPRPSMAKEPYFQFTRMTYLCFTTRQWEILTPPDSWSPNVITPTTTITTGQGYSLKGVNTVYGLPNANIGQFHTKGCELGSWMASILCPRKIVPWATTKRDIPLNDFKAEARLWLSIICIRVSPCTYMTIVTEDQARMVACILSGISLNVGELVSSEWQYFQTHRGTLLLFPSLITGLCKRAGVVEYAADTWVCPGSLICPLKFRGKGAPGQRKKRKMNSGKSAQQDTDSCRPSSANAFDDISIQIQGVRELLSRLPKGPG
ncbi:hypothetical protein FXO38_19562 [Capsicum annuum]|nr:hypothetical protein FXO38_19562 [Capsicum annuum]